MYHYVTGTIYRDVYMLSHIFIHIDVCCWCFIMFCHVFIGTSGGGVRPAGLPFDLAGHERVRHVRVADHHGHQHARLLRVRLFTGQAGTFVSPPPPLPLPNQGLIT